MGPTFLAYASIAPWWKRAESPGLEATWHTPSDASLGLATEVASTLLTRAQAELQAMLPQWTPACDVSATLGAAAMELDFTPVSTDPRSPAQRITLALALVGAVLRGINCIPRRVRDEEASALQRLAEAVETKE